MKKIIFSLIVLLLALFILWKTLGSSPVEVNAGSCKTKNAECHWNMSGHDCCPGLSCNFWRFDGGRKKYKCETIVVPTISPKPTATPTVEPTVTPTVTPTVEPTVTPTPEPEVTPTPEPEVTPAPEQPQIKVEEAPVFFAPIPDTSCKEISPVKAPANPLVWRSGNDAIVQWQPTEGRTVNIYYYNNHDRNDAHALRDILNNGKVSIGYLGSKDWTFGIQQSNDCAGGSIYWIVDGDTRNWTLFR